MERIWLLLQWIRAEIFLLRWAIFWLLVVGAIFYTLGQGGLVPGTDEEVGTVVATSTVVAPNLGLVQEGPALGRAEPLRLRIPTIQVDAGFVPPLGLEENNEVAVPDSDTEVGWYQYSPTPGEVGPAVILGHVDSSTGPAIFFSLGQVHEGDDIFVDREDGSVAHFTVEKLERYKQSEFPTEKVYGNINYAGLRLITCSGIFSKGVQKYSHNLVVYAKLVEDKNK